jgi:hypothetical protein
MALPEFNEEGDLPVGIHRATFEEVLERFGQGTPQRHLVALRLVRIHKLAFETGKLLRFVIFGSFITAKPAPNDVDIILVMADDFDMDECAEQTRPLFEHMRAHEVFGASVFSVRPLTVLLESVDQFLGYWQVKRDKGQRGIVEVILEEKK